MRVQILLDTSGSMDYGYERRMTKLQYGCYLTAILSYLMTRQQDSVGLTTFDTEIGLDMPARSSPRHFNEMMHRLEAIKPGGETDVASTLHKLAGRFKRRCLIVLLSDLYDDPDEVIRAAPFPPSPPRGDPVSYFGSGGDRFSLQGSDRVSRPGKQRPHSNRPGLRPRGLPQATRRVSRDLSPGVCGSADRLRVGRHLDAVRFYVDEIFE